MNVKDYPLWTALITPMLSSGEVDYDSLLKLLKLQEEAQNGLLVLGSTGEGLNLDDDEKEKIIDFVVEQKLNVPIMVGVGGINLNKTKKWVRYLEGKKVDCYLMVTPLYAKPGPLGQYNWFKTLMDEVKRPVMLYNIPSRSGCALSYDAVAKLQGHPNFWAIKEASGSIIEFKRYVEIGGEIEVFSGDDAMLPAFANFGAKGVVSVAANVWPFETKEYVKQCMDKRLEDTELWKRCCDTLFTVSNPVPVKRLMYQLEKITSPTLRPPLDADDLRDVNLQISSHEAILSWYKDQLI